MSGLFLSVDWGTSHVRLRLAEAGGGICAETGSDQGASVLAGGDLQHRAKRFETELTALLASLPVSDRTALQGVPVVVSGMASSSIGWRELPYAKLPLRLDGSGLSWQELSAVPIDGGCTGPVYLISGVRSRADIMRGEETELIGLFSSPEARGLQERCLVILPGTHSKHVEICEGAIREFRTYMTGELYQLLLTGSVLRYSTAAADDGDAEGAEEEEAGFEAGIARSQEGALLQLLFEVRAKQVLDGTGEHWNAGFLSGLLIGAEIRDCRESCGTELPLLLHAPASLRVRYDCALSRFGFNPLHSLQAADERRVPAVGGHEQFLKQHT